MRIGIIEILRNDELINPRKEIIFTGHKTEESALRKMAQFSENQIISPSVKAANNIVKKWLVEDYDIDYRYRFAYCHIQAFMCTFTDNYRVIRLYDRDSIIEACREINKPPAIEKDKKDGWLTWWAARRYIPPKSKHDIPYKKKTFYENTDYKSPKNGKFRATDFPRKYFEEEMQEGEIIDFTVRGIKPVVYYAWDDKFSHKYWQRNGHICWKNYKKNKKQWMKNRNNHKDTSYKKESKLENEWDIYIEEEELNDNDRTNF